MGRNKAVVVGHLDFPSKEMAKAFYPSIRDAYSDGERLQPEHHAFLADLISLHPDAAEKIGSGIQFFSVESDFQYQKTRHFAIHRVDGTSTDVSFLACINGRNIRKDVLGAMREAVADQIVQFRNAFFSTHGDFATCPLAGILSLRKLTMSIMCRLGSLVPWQTSGCSGPAFASRMSASHPPAIIRSLHQ
jgi:hypothetical protein